MTEFAEIKKHYATNPLTGGAYLDRLEWVGSPYAPVKTSLLFLKNFSHLMPWEFEIVSDLDAAFIECIIIRTDVPIPSYAYYRFEKDAIAVSNWLKRIGARLVLTAQVWGCANVPPCEYPYWGHLKMNTLLSIIGALSWLTLLLIISMFLGICLMSPY